MEIIRQLPSEWFAADQNSPAHGLEVDIGRFDMERGAVVSLDTVFWFPEHGNWNLVGMYWRPHASVVNQH
jgi:hypothetical protein